jgi:hypothetical protein
MELPTLGDKVTKLVTKLPFIRTKETRFIPNDEYAEFWNAVYQTLAQSGIFTPPIKTDFEERINPYFGCFGNRFDITTQKSDSFHTGIDIEARRKTQVRAIAGGILEYAGFGIVNGNYVMLSHPDIISEDGYVLHSIYMHLRDTKVKFSSYQKMLREISLRSYPLIPVPAETCLGTVGDTGSSHYPKGYIHTHLQIEFRNREGHSIYLNPGRILGITKTENLTRAIKSQKEFVDLYVRNRKDIFQRKLDAMWAPYIKQTSL